MRPSIAPSPGGRFPSGPSKAPVILRDQNSRQVPARQTFLLGDSKRVDQASLGAVPTAVVPWSCVERSGLIALQRSPFSDSLKTRLPARYTAPFSWRLPSKGEFQWKR